jgi:hypothetical protein
VQQIQMESLRVLRQFCAVAAFQDQLFYWDRPEHPHGAPAHGKLQ